MTAKPAQPNQIIDVKPLGAQLASSTTSTLIKSDRLKVLRLVLPAGKTIPTHKADGNITVHCLEGRIAFTAQDQTQHLEAGQMLYLTPGVDHALVSIEDASVLVTIQT